MSVFLENNYVMIRTETKFAVRYYETDQMAIVHHSNYIRYFETARDEFLIEIGYPVEEVDKDGVMFALVSLDCHYRHPMRMGDTVVATCEVDTLPAVKFIIKQEVYNQDGVLCADGTVVLAFLSKATGRPCRCPEKLLRLLEAKMG